MRTFDVSLPAKRRVIFPRLCVVCEKPEPDSVVELSIVGAETGSMVMEAADLAAGGTYQGANTSNNIQGIPACQSCASGLKWYHRIYKIILYTAWIPALILLFVLHLPTAVFVILVLASVIAPPILSIIFPPAFGATYLNKKATFEFKSQKVADKFKRLNGVTE